MKKNGSTSVSPEITCDPEGLRISFRWRKHGSIVHAVFMFFIASAMIFVLVGVCANLPDGGETRTPAGTDLAFLASIVSVVTGLLYMGTGYLLNATSLLVKQDGVRMEQRGLPWPGSRWIPVKTIRDVFVRKRQTRFRQGRQGPPFYSVFLDVDGKAIRFYGEFAEKGAADSLAARVRNSLSLKLLRRVSRIDRQLRELA